MIIPLKWVILKWCSLWNDIWQSFRKERQRPQSFRNALWLSLRNDISKSNCLLHACGVFRVFAYWILTKFSRQTLGWKIVCQSFRDALWLSFRNERQRSRSFWNNISTVLLKWQMIILSKWAIQFCIRFDMIYDCLFEMTAQKFSYRESFSSARVA